MKSNVLIISLWLAQGLLSALLLWAAAMKLFASPTKLAEMWPWIAENRKLVKLTGVFDALAGLGPILPMLTGILPQLTFYAAIGTFTLMLAAIIFHVCRGEGSQVGINVVIAVITVFIAWGRW